MSRAAMAFAAGNKDAENKTPVDPDAITSAGNWSRQAQAGLQRQIEEAREDARRAATGLYQGVLSGVVAVPIPVENIIDEVGSDRVASDTSPTVAQDQADLTSNIKSRGLRTPLRVRPTDPDWRPLDSDPFYVQGQTFALQSGRRRLAACKELGITPIAFISFPAENAALDDLLERYFENVARKDLSIAERLISIAAIAENMDGTQDEIAGAIGVSRSALNRALRLMQNYSAVQKALNLATASRDEIDAFLSKQAVSTGRQESARIALPFRRKAVTGGSLRLAATKTGGRRLTLELESLSDAQAEALALGIEKILKKI